MVRGVGILLFTLFQLTASAAPKPIHVTFIGDSHSVGPFGAQINQWLRAQSKKIDFDFYAAGGSAPLQWMNGAISKCGYEDHSSLSKSPKVICNSSLKIPVLKDLLAKTSLDPSVGTQQKVILIALGTNFSDRASQFSGDRASTIRLLRSIPEGYRCVWIGPPDMRRKDSKERNASAYALIQSAIQSAAKITGTDPCTLIDSRLFSHYPEPPYSKKENADSIHYGYPGATFKRGTTEAKRWAKGVINSLKVLGIK